MPFLEPVRARFDRRSAQRDRRKARPTPSSKSQVRSAADDDVRERTDLRACSTTIPFWGSSHRRSEWTRLRGGPRSHRDADGERRLLLGPEWGATPVAGSERRPRRAVDARSKLPTDVPTDRRAFRGIPESNGGRVAPRSHLPNDVVTDPIEALSRVTKPFPGTLRPANTSKQARDFRFRRRIATHSSRLTRARR
jgi:hypothetical protein